MPSTDTIENFNGNMIKLFLLALIFTQIAGYGQIQKCKYAKNEIDNFSEIQVTTSKWYSIGEGDNKKQFTLKAELTKKGDSIYILKLWAEGGALGCVSQSSTAHFKSSDGQVLTLQHIGGVDCGNTAYVGGMSAHANPHIILPLTSKARAFLSKPITMVKLDFAEVTGTYNIALPMNFQQIIKCVEGAPRLRS